MNPELNDWAPFFAAQVGASAALVGLVAVAISINLTRILSFPRLPSRAAECLVILTSALIVSSLALMPGRQISVFGGEAFLLGLASTVVSLINFGKQLGQPRDISLFKIVSATSVSALATLSLAVGGALIVWGDNSGLDWVGSSVIISLAVGVMNTWVLLVEILR